nr:hypothetical protein [Candidatus Peregrinibacteria bacterium]
MKKIAISAIAILLAASVVFFTQTQLKNYHGKVRAEIIEQPLFLLPSDSVKLFSLGFDNLVADLLWLKTVQYVGGHISSRENNTLYQYLNLITDLDPQFKHPYLFGELLLPEKGKTGQAIALAEKGLRNVPNAWEIPYYLGFIYFFHEENYEKAADLYELAATKEGVLLSAKKIAATLRSQANKHIISLEMFKDLYEN